MVQVSRGIECELSEANSLYEVGRCGISPCVIYPLYYYIDKVGMLVYYQYGKTEYLDRLLFPWFAML